MAEQAAHILNKICSLFLHLIEARIVATITFKLGFTVVLVFRLDGYEHFSIADETMFGL